MLYVDANDTRVSNVSCVAREIGALSKLSRVTSLDFRGKTSNAKNPDGNPFKHCEGVRGGGGGCEWVRSRSINALKY